MGVVITTGLAAEDAGTARFAAAVADPVDAAGARAVDASSVAGDCPAEQAVPAPVTATTATATAAARTPTVTCLVGLCTVAS